MSSQNPKNTSMKEEDNGVTGLPAAFIQPNEDPLKTNEVDDATENNEDVLDILVASGHIFQADPSDDKAKAVNSKTQAILSDAEMLSKSKASSFEPDAKAKAAAIDSKASSAHPSDEKAAVPPTSLLRAAPSIRPVSLSRPGAHAVSIGHMPVEDTADPPAVEMDSAPAAVESAVEPVDTLESGLSVAFAIDDDILPVAREMPEQPATNDRKKSSLRVFGMATMAVVVIVVIVIVVLAATGSFGGNGNGNGNGAATDSGNSNGTSIDTHTEASDYVLSLLPDSTRDALQTPDSPQLLAYEWILEDPFLLDYSEDRILQRYALATFYYSTGGGTKKNNNTGWTNSNHWLSHDHHECEWFTRDTMENPLHGPVPDVAPEAEQAPCQMHCDALQCTFGSYQHLWLWENELQGTIPPELFLLSSLQTVSITANAVKGSIPPELGKLTDLYFLGLVANPISGVIPTQVGLLTSLHTIGVIFTEVEGSIPTEFGLLSNSLVKLFLDFNFMLTGPIPSELGTLSKLEALYLGSLPGLTGTIPTELGRLESMIELYIIESTLACTLPTELGELHKMEILRLEGGSFTGTLPTELGALKSTLRLDLTNSQLTGSIPSQLGQMDFLWRLHLEGNQLTGTIPTQLGALKSLQDMEGFLNQTALNGTIPQLVRVFPAAAARYQSEAGLYLKNNQLLGPIPTELAHLTSMRVLDLSDNSLLTGTLPQGINDSSLEFLNISGTSILETNSSQIFG